MSLTKNRSERAGQRGSLVLGIIIGLLLGLALALGVALYIAKVPVPFVDKVPHRTPEQDAAEVERNKNWDPNAPLAGKQTPPAPLQPAASVAEGSADAAKTASSAASAAERRAAKAEAAAKAASDTATKSTRDPAAILAGQMPASAPVAKASAPVKPGAEPFVYFVQAGAFSSADDAEQQRAKLAIQGIGTKVTEREQGGRTVYRVRLGPFDAREEAEAQQDRLKGMGTDAALVRVDRPH